MEHVHEGPGGYAAPGVRAISAAQPFSWLGYGLRDLRAAPGPSLFHGIVFAPVGIGSATWLLGLVIVMPILGHASWHAYRNLVERAAADPMH